MEHKIAIRITGSSYRPEGFIIIADIDGVPGRERASADIGSGNFYDTCADAFAVGVVEGISEGGIWFIFGVTIAPFDIEIGIIGDVIRVIDDTQSMRHAATVGARGRTDDTRSWLTLVVHHAVDCIDAGAVGCNDFNWEDTQRCVKVGFWGIRHQVVAREIGTAIAPDNAQGFECISRFEINTKSIRIGNKLQAVHPSWKIGIVKVLVEYCFGVRGNIDGSATGVDTASGVFDEEFNVIGTYLFEVESLCGFADDGIGNFDVVNFPPVFNGIAEIAGRGIGSGDDGRQPAGMREVIGKYRRDIAGISFCGEEDKCSYQTYNYFILHGLVSELLNIEL